MSSAARQLAKESNARLSTGPSTPEGKARSSQNARKHGLTSAHLVIAPEERAEFEQFLTELETEIRPQGPLQQILFDQLAASAWNLRRVCGMELELTAQIKTSTDLLNNPDLTAQLDRLARHHTRIERTFYRALRELKALQTDVALAPTLPVQFIERAQPLASRTQIAKRTQTLTIGDRRYGRDYWSGADAEADAVQSAFENSETPKVQTAAC
jgi:hypothetical protein